MGNIGTDSKFLGMWQMHFLQSFSILHFLQFLIAIRIFLFLFFWAIPSGAQGLFLDGSAQESLLVATRGPYQVPMIERGLAACKATPPAVQTTQQLLQANILKKWGKK